MNPEFYNLKPSILLISSAFYRELLGYQVIVFCQLQIQPLDIYCPSLDVQRLRLKDPSFDFAPNSSYRSDSLPGALPTCTGLPPPRDRASGRAGGRPGGPFLAGVRAGQPERPRKPPPAASPAPSAPEGRLPKSLPLPALRLTSSGSRCSGDRAQQPVPTERTTLLGTHRYPCPLSHPLGISSGLRARTVSATPGAEGEADRCPECPLPPDRLDLREGLATQGGEGRPSPVGTVALAVGGRRCEAPPPARV
ncbi:unnamed protein product [Rangifer tarandus platyrhynchus]|uniref:Uncharacterized protein n=1 Tax=Rangifer tarandus platyrhynchus TaxID=3082113 RepID=A0AC59Y730_RANTA